MNHIRLLVYAFLISILSLTFISPTNENIVLPTSQSTDVFLLGAWGDEADHDRTYITDQNAFGMNLWHSLGVGHTHYLGQHMPLGWESSKLLNINLKHYTLYYVCILKS